MVVIKQTFFREFRRVPLALRRAHGGLEKSEGAFALDGETGTYLPVQLLTLVSLLFRPS